MISCLGSKVQYLISSLKLKLFRKQKKKIGFTSDCSLQFSVETAQKSHISQLKANLLEKYGFMKVAYQTHLCYIQGANTSL